MQVLTLKAEPRNILIPVSMVAQILRHENEEEYAHSLPFINSVIRWREFRIPLVYSSHMLGAASDLDRDYQRAVVLWPMEGTDNSDLLALTSMDSPKVLTIDAQSGNSEVIQQTNGQADAGYVLGKAQLDGIEGVIPDLSALARDIFSNRS